MKLKEIYKLIIDIGIENDPREKDLLEKMFTRRKDKFDRLNDNEKIVFDIDELWNPYADTRILYGDEDMDVKNVLVGIDVETEEILLADRLREKGMKIDLVVSHHPMGKPLADLHKVMSIQADMLGNYGIPINIADSLMSKRSAEVKRGLMSGNHFREIDAARMLDVPIMCCHTPADNSVNSFLEKILNENKPEYVEDIIKILKDIPEYKYYTEIGMPPALIGGKEENRCGKVLIDMTGGTSGSKELIEYAAKNGIGTVVEMHMREDYLKEAEKYFVNVLIAGHMPSDSLGMNLVFDRLEQHGVEIISFSSFYRYSRNK